MAHIDVGHTGEAAVELAAIFNGHSNFDTPKPSRLIERILHIAADEDSIISTPLPALAQLPMRC